MGLEESTPSSCILPCAMVSVSSPWVMQSSRHKSSRISGLSQSSFEEVGALELEGELRESCPGPGVWVAELPGVPQLLAWVFEVNPVCHP